MCSDLVFLDLRAVFDTVDHSTLLDRLKHWVGLSDTALKWFSSNLSNRKFYVSINNYMSSFASIKCGASFGTNFSLSVHASPRTYYPQK